MYTNYKVNKVNNYFPSEKYCEQYEKFCELRRNKNHFVKYDLHPYLPKDHPRFLEFCTSNTSKTKYKGYSLVQRDEQKKIWKYITTSEKNVL